MAQSLPRHFQFREKRLLADGNVCLHLTEVTIQAAFVLLAPLKADCTRLSAEFSTDEGYVFPLNGKDQHSRDCRIAMGVNPEMSCSDGEVLTVWGFTAKEPYRVEGTISHAASWNGSRLVIAMDDFDSRFSMAGGSGSKPKKQRLVYYLEFSFAGGNCVLEKIKRSRVFDGTRQNVRSVEGLDCSIMR